MMYAYALARTTESSSPTLDESTSKTGEIAASPALNSGSTVGR